MRKLLIVAALLALSGTAHAGAIKETINFGGRTIKIEIPGKCRDISCISVSLPGKGGNTVEDDEPTPAPAPAATAQPQPAPQPQAAPAPQANVPAATQVQPATKSANEFSGSAVPWSERDKIASQAQPAPAPVAETRTAAVTPAPAAAPQTSGDSPIGVWQTEKKEGLVRIQDCGGNLCGYSVEKDGSNGKQVLINMKPGAANKWSGTIHDIRGGGKYSSTITLRGQTTLAVQGCAFGGMFCGGETWKRAQ
jgi:uncharacterized protein (DUF2147 family)